MKNHLPPLPANWDVSRLCWSCYFTVYNRRNVSNMLNESQRWIRTRSSTTSRCRTGINYWTSFPSHRTSTHLNTNSMFSEVNDVCDCLGLPRRSDATPVADCVTDCVTHSGQQSTTRVILLRTRVTHLGRISSTRVRPGHLLSATRVKARVLTKSSVLFQINYSHVA